MNIKLKDSKGARYTGGEIAVGIVFVLLLGALIVGIFFADVYLIYRSGKHIIDSGWNFWDVFWIAIGAVGLVGLASWATNGK